MSYPKKDKNDTKAKEKIYSLTKRNFKSQIEFLVYEMAF
jgi:hypothetical protein